MMTVVGTRPEIIRLSRVLALLEAETNHVLVHTGQNYDYELNQVFFDELEIVAPRHVLSTAGASPMETIGNVIRQVEPVIDAERPDAFLVLGDTNSCLAAIVAKRRRVPVFHMEAGNRCFDDRVPEEINRRLVDHVSDINLTYSDLAREYLIREGRAPECVIKVGSPMAEVLSYYRSRIDGSQISDRLKLSKDDFFLVSAHREENVDAEPNLMKLIQILNRLADEYGKRIVVSTHPRTRKRVLDVDVATHALVEFHNPFGMLDFVKLELDARAVLSDSGTITEEASILNLRALNIREAHERPEGMEEGAAMLVGLNVDRVLQGLAVLEKQGRGEVRTVRVVGDYDVPNVSQKVLRILISYTDYVNRTVWRSY